MNDIALIKEGNERAFEAMYHCYHEQLYFYVLKQTGSQFLAEEVVQQTFLKCWTSRMQLPEDVPVTAILLQIAGSSLIDLLRKKATERKAMQQLATTASEDHLLHNIQEKELTIHIHHAINSLPPVRRQVFRLSRENGLTYAQIADELSISVKTVESHITKAIKHLRKRLAVSPLFLLLLHHPFLF
ncbi:RNA polymerase sigma-70 factor [Chitinophaga defluvii]|mgnify:CR=1 FL=1|uniref:RNA polymerase sigma-70 factor n=1 Tax=Chitinophaga defluvii TaxID=3163343 RepID=A0ABV2T331_9BACT